MRNQSMAEILWLWAWLSLSSPQLDVKSGFSMLGVGIACVGIYLMKRKTDI